MLEEDDELEEDELEDDDREEDVQVFFDFDEPHVSFDRDELLVSFDLEDPHVSLEEWDLLCPSDEDFHSVGLSVKEVGIFDGSLVTCGTGFFVGLFAYAVGR